jgi:2,3-bisphosphoglycerate-dependent phosphoglycerate mutase
MKAVIFSLLVLVCFHIGGCVDMNRQESDMEIRNIILVRHAEKADNDPHDPDLLPVGLQRADILAEIFREWPFDKVYSTDYKRTLATIQPLADNQGLNIQIYEHKTLYDFAQQILKSDDKNILVCGHTNTTPELINLLIGEEKYDEMPMEEYNTIWWVQIAEGHKPTVNRMKYPDINKLVNNDN